MRRTVSGIVGASVHTRVKMRMYDVQAPHDGADTLEIRHVTMCPVDVIEIINPHNILKYSRVEEQVCEWWI